MAQIRAVTLDLDDTLWPFAPVAKKIQAALEGWLTEHAPATHARFDQQAAFAVVEQVYAQRPDLAHDLGAVRREALRQMFEAAGDDPSRIDEVFVCLNDARQQVEPYPDAVPALERLSTRFPLVAITNGNADLERIGLAHHFQAIVTSETVGVAKPAAQVFHVACELLGLAPGEVLHAGDHVVIDVQGALDAGLQAAWVHRDFAGEPPSSAMRAYDMTQLADQLLSR